MLNLDFTLILKLDFFNQFQSVEAKKLSEFLEQDWIYITVYVYLMLDTILDFLLAVEFESFQLAGCSKIIRCTQKTYCNSINTNYSNSCRAKDVPKTLLKVFRYQNIVKNFGTFSMKHRQYSTIFVKNTPENGYVHRELLGIRKEKLKLRIRTQNMGVFEDSGIYIVVGCYEIILSFKFFECVKVVS